MKTLLRLVRDERGTETVEWALILGVIILAAIAAAGLAKTHMETIYDDMESELATAAGAV